MVAVLQPHGLPGCGCARDGSVFYRRRFRRVLDLCGSALSNWMVGVLISSCCRWLSSQGIGLMAAGGLKLVVSQMPCWPVLPSTFIPNVWPT